MKNKNESIKETIQSFEMCKKRKSMTIKTAEQIIKTPTTSIFEKIFIDFCGLLAAIPAKLLTSVSSIKITID